MTGADAHIALGLNPFTPSHLRSTLSMTGADAHIALGLNPFTPSHLRSTVRKVDAS